MIARKYSSLLDYLRWKRLKTHRAILIIISTYVRYSRRSCQTDFSGEGCWKRPMNFFVADMVHSVQNYLKLVKALAISDVVSRRFFFFFFFSTRALARASVSRSDMRLHINRTVKFTAESKASCKPRTRSCWTKPTKKSRNHSRRSKTTKLQIWRWLISTYSNTFANSRTNCTKPRRM